MKAGEECGVTLVRVGHVPEAILADLPRVSDSVPLPSTLLDADGCLRADELLRGWEPRLECLTILLTSSPLASRECRSLLGLSSWRKRTAVVTSHGLGTSGTREPEGTEVGSRRLRNLVLHELGHLAGRRHCSAPGCLMNPVGEPRELDAREDVLCPECARRRGATPVPTLPDEGSTPVEKGP